MSSEEVQPEVETEYTDSLRQMPFDPSLIRIRRDPMNLGDILDKIKHGELNFTTDFQREPNLWKEREQSRLIESILLQLPLPAFYFEQILSPGDQYVENEKWNIIDGLQRCCVFKKFIVDDNLELSDLEFLHDYNGKRFSELPRPFQRRITQCPITVYLLEEKTPEEVKFNIFKRINTGGISLNNQEILHAMNQGIAAEFVKELAESSSFIQASSGKISTDRMQDREFVTRFLSFYIQTVGKYESDLESFMATGMKQVARLQDHERADIRTRFNRALDALFKIFADQAFRKPKVQNRRQPLNKALFEILTVNVALLGASSVDILVRNKEIFLQKFTAIMNDSKIMRSITTSTGEAAQVRLRHAAMQRIISETIEHNIYE